MQKTHCPIHISPTESTPAMSLAAPTLVHVCDLHVTVAAPIEAGQVQGLGSQGKRRIIPITGGTVRGRINGVVLPGGADFQMVVSSTTADLDARYMLRLDDGSHVYVLNSALRRGSAEDIAKLVKGEAVPPERIYFRCVPRFEVESPALHWMTQSVFVGTGARFPDRVEISIFELL
jgi:Protein of unknown function (DUF3237)